MKNYTKTYYQFFDLIPSDIIICEICDFRPSVDIHHIVARSQEKSLENDIINLMAVCRECHNEYGDRKIAIKFLFKKHIQNLNNYKQADYESKLPNKYKYEI